MDEKITVNNIVVTSNVSESLKFYENNEYDKKGYELPTLSMVSCVLFIVIKC